MNKVDLNDIAEIAQLEIKDKGYLKVETSRLIDKAVFDEVMDWEECDNLCLENGIAVYCVFQAQKIMKIKDDGKLEGDRDINEPAIVWQPSLNANHTRMMRKKLFEKGVEPSTYYEALHLYVDKSTPIINADLHIQCIAAIRAARSYRYQSM